MPNVEEEVVSIKFDNAQFERETANSLRSLQNLNKGLKLEGASKGLNDVAAASSKFSLKNVESGIQGISDKFKAMSVIGVTALATITNKAVEAGGAIVKSLTIGPISDGFREYETTLNSIQTIMANTGRSGKKGLAEVNAALSDLNHYSDKTIYNFTEMAKNIGTFTAAGVKLDTATAAIKGIANLAAISGANSEKASGAMYQLSQALAAGKVSLEDWNSVVQAGLGGKVFQNSLIETARNHGIAIDKMIKDEGSFRLTLKSGWLSSKILTETLSKFTGDLNARQLKSMGYSQKQIAEILKLGKTAQDAATKVKTISQLMSTLQEAVGSGWSQTWQLIFGDFNEAKGTFTEVNNVLGKFISSSADARNKVLGDWKALGGRTALLDAISNSFNALISVMRPIRDAFREIFPATTGKQLYDFTVAVRDFTAGLKIGGTTANELKRTFAGFFAVIGIGWEIVKQVVATIFGLFQTAGEGSGSFLKTTASIGDFLVAVHKAVAEGSGLTTFFQGLGRILAIPINLLKFLASLFGKLFDNFKPDEAAQSFVGLADKLRPLGRVGEIINAVMLRVFSAIDRVKTVLTPLADEISGLFDKIGNSAAGVSGKFDFSNVLGAINTGLFAGIVILFKKFLNRDKGGLGGIFDGLKESIEGLVGTLKGMQHALNAAALLEIAGAIAILALAMKTLGGIDPEGLTAASVAIAGMFTQLGVALFAFQKISTFAGLVKMPIVAGSMILLATAVGILATAVKSLSSLNWDQLARGLTGLAGTLAALVIAMKFMPSASGLFLTSRGMVVLASAVKILVGAVADLAVLSWEQLAKGLLGVGAILAELALFSLFAKVNVGAGIQGTGIILLAAGIKILASALKDLGQLSWEEIAKGLVAMGGGLILIAGALAVIPPSSVLSSAGVLVVAASLSLIGVALKNMGGMDWENIAKGLLSMAGALVLISAALILIPPTSLVSAGAILVVSVALQLIAKALNSMGGMDWESIAKSLITLAGSLTIIAIAMYAMTGALPGAAALLVVAGALAVLTPVLLALGSMDWESILKALAALAGVFLVLGVAGVALGGLVPILIGLGAAVTLLGVGLALAGAGVFLFATGMAALAVSGAAGAIAITAIVSSLAGVIPTVMKQIAAGIVAFAKVIAVSGTAMSEAMTTVILSLLKAINKTAPQIIDTLFKLLNKLNDTMLKYVPHMVDTGLQLITGILNGIAKNTKGLVNAGTNIVVNFINGIAANLPRVIQAGFDLILKFVNSLADAIRANAPAMHKAGSNLAKAIIDGMVVGLLGGNSSVVTAAEGVARSALNAAKHFLGVKSPSKEFEKIGEFVNLGFAKGLSGGTKQDVINAFNDLKGMLKDAMKSSAQDIEDAEKKLKKLTSARLGDATAIQQATDKLAQARNEHKATSAAYAELTKHFNDEKTKLGQLATQYQKVTDKLKAAQDALATAKQIRDDYNKSIVDEYQTLPDITGETTVTDYITSLRKEVTDTKTFSEALQKLRDLGLNDEMYKELLAKGVTALPFVQELVSAGKNGVDAINSLDAQLVMLAKNLGQKASTNLYQAGVDSAQALVNGLASQQDALVAQMERIADAMVAALNKKLAVANNLGKLMDAGASEAKPKLGEVVVKTDSKKAVPKISSNYAGLNASVGNTYSAASAVSAMTGKGVTTSAKPAATPSVTFVQNNTSPKALTSAEIYRQTSNQLSVVKKGVLV
jgi:tape measure domain-containing protein